MNQGAMMAIMLEKEKRRLQSDGTRAVQIISRAKTCREVMPYVHMNIKAEFRSMRGYIGIQAIESRIESAMKGLLDRQLELAKKEEGVEERRRLIGQLRQDVQYLRGHFPALVHYANRRLDTMK